MKIRLADCADIAFNCSRYAFFGRLELLLKFFHAEFEIASARKWPHPYQWAVKEFYTRQMACQALVRLASKDYVSCRAQLEQT